MQLVLVEVEELKLFIHRLHELMLDHVGRWIITEQHEYGSQTRYLRVDVDASLVVDKIELKSKKMTS